METDEAQFRPFLAPATASGSPPKKELKDYPVRDFRSSHLYRIGLHLFKTSDFRCRRRILIAAPRESSSVQLERKNKDFSCQSKANFTAGDDDDDDDDFLFPGKKRYRNFLAERTSMRKELEGIGDTKKWLLSKERTPLEEQRLRLMDHKEPRLEQKTISHSSISESTSLLGSRDSRCWKLKHQMGFFKQHKDAWMEQARKEFEEFKEYCKHNEISVDMELAKNALLPPSDDPKCWSDLKCLLCPHSVFSEMASEEKKRMFGGQDEPSEPKRKPRKPKTEKVVLSTGSCELQVLVDTWLNFKLYKKMTRAHQRSYTSPEKFWPGQNLHLLRVPEIGPRKANSEMAIFYPVDLKSRHSNVQVLSWPDNEAGHVQVGCSSKKCYHL